MVALTLYQMTSGLSSPFGENRPSFDPVGSRAGPSRRFREFATVAIVSMIRISPSTQLFCAKVWIFPKRFGIRESRGASASPSDDRIMQGSTSLLASRQTAGGPAVASPHEGNRMTIQNQNASVSERSMVWLFQINRLNVDRTVGNLPTRPPENLASEPPNTIQGTLQHRSIVSTQSTSDVIASRSLCFTPRPRHLASQAERFRRTVPPSFCACAQLTTLSPRVMMVTASIKLHRIAEVRRRG